MSEDKDKKPEGTAAPEAAASKADSTAAPAKTGDRRREDNRGPGGNNRGPGGNYVEVVLEAIVAVVMTVVVVVKRKMMDSLKRWSSLTVVPRL